MTGPRSNRSRAALAGIWVRALVLIGLAGCAGGENLRAAGDAIAPGRIAHAGGAVGGATYTNSLEALDHNHALGFRFFEIDLVWTSDDELVALHDWDDNFRHLFGEGLEAPLSAAEFDRASEKVSDLTLLSLDGVLSWLASHPDAYLITDVKSRNLEALTVIAKRRPRLRGRIIPQIYDSNEYPPVKELGFEAIIWTLYRQRISDFGVARQLEQMQLFGIAMPAARARRGRLAAYLQSVGVPAFAHTVNDPKGLMELRARGIAEVYTDFLPPCQPPSAACVTDE